MQKNNIIPSLSVADHSINSSLINDPSLSEADHSINSSLPKAMPLVSISCITYNHAKFIRQTLDGFLMQQPPTCIQHSAFNNQHWFEILIHDDCSTDGTTDIVREYAEKYPDIIKPMYETENQWKLGHTVGSAEWNYPRATGKYIATCEGDDYWTDPLKLQKQIDFMESHPEYSVCFSTFRNHVVKTDDYLETEPTRLLKANGNPEGMDIDLNLYFKGWYTQPLTMLFRADALDFDLYKKYKSYRDTHEIYHLLKTGKGRLINIDSGVRNMHSCGVASLLPDAEAIPIELRQSRELYDLNHDEFTQQYYINILQWAIYKSQFFTKQRLTLSWKRFCLDWNFYMFCKNLLRK